MSDTEPVLRPAPGGDRGFDLKHGQVLDGRYEIVERIGAGGMGVVYKARRLMLDDTVAIKQLAPLSLSRANRTRFLLEARAAAHIRHPNVVEIFDFGDPPVGAPYIVMEYLEGPTLARCLRDGSLDVARALEVLAPICAAVEAGHRRGVIHRDLKPSNIILTTSDDGREMVKVLDFGLARFHAGTKPRLTTSGAIIGTAQYMSPEQARGEQALPASDIFALGILLYEMVTGAAPFLGKTPVMTALAVSRGSYEPADAIVPGLPRQLVSAIDQALQQDPSERPETPEQLARLAEAGLPRIPSASRMVTASRSGQGLEPGAATMTHGVDGAGEPGPEAAVLAFDHFVGRERQLRRLEEEYETSVRGSGRVVVVVGEAGIGKTSLVERFVKQLADRNAVVVLRGRFYDYAGSKPPPFESFLDMLQSETMVPSGRGSGVANADSLGAVRGDLAHAIHQSETMGDAEGRRWRIFTALAEAFAARAGTLPLVLVLDDIHWATGADLVLIDHLHRSLAHRGTLFLATARRDESARPAEAETELSRWLDRLASRRAHAVLALRPFDQHEVREWFDRGFGNIQIRARDLKRIARATGANPYCLVEVVRHLLETGAIDWRGGWRCGPLADIELPETVASLVRARLAGLDPKLRELLETASVVGDEMRLETLRLASKIEARELEVMVDDAISLLLLADTGLSSGNDLRFISETVRQVLYRGMSGRARRRAHRRVVAALEAIYQGELDRLAPVLAYHYHAVGAWGRALSCGIRALSDALERSDNNAADELLTRAQNARDAAASVPALDRERLDFLGGTLCRRLGRLEEAVESLRSAERSEDASLSAAARLEHARCHLDRGELDAALETARSVRRFARELGERGRELQAWMFEASCLLRLGLNQEAAAMLDRLLVAVADGDASSIRSLALRERAWALLKSGAFNQAQDDARRALELARSAGDLLAQHHALSALAAVLGESGDNAGSIPYHRRALELARRLSLRRREAIDLANLGERLYESCGYETALEHFRSALAIFIEIGDVACEGDCRVNVGRAMLARGDAAEALTMLERGRSMCEAIGRTEYAGLAWLSEGEVRFAQGDFEAASGAYARAQDRFAQIDSHYLWRAHLGRAKAERAAGRGEAASEFARLAAERVAAQRTQLPEEADASGFEEGASAVVELLSELGGGSR